jgi:hypothetical protein
MNGLNHFTTSVLGVVMPTNICLLIFDGHGNHLTLQTVDEANKTGIKLLRFPIDTTYVMQPLDVSICLALLRVKGWESKLDGHDNHIALQILDEANKINIDLLIFLHTNHIVQSSNVSVFGSFKDYFMDESKKKF